MKMLRVVPESPHLHAALLENKLPRAKLAEEIHHKMYAILWLLLLCHRTHRIYVFGSGPCPIARLYLLG